MAKVQANWHCVLSCGLGAWATWVLFSVHFGCWWSTIEAISHYGKCFLCRTESEKRHLEAYSTADAEAAEQRGELRRRLSAAEVARDQATAELAAIEQKVEEARKEAASKATSKMPSFRIQGMPSGGVLEAHMQGTVVNEPKTEKDVERR
eukprot:g11089.t1